MTYVLPVSAAAGAMAFAAAMAGAQQARPFELAVRERVLLYVGDCPASQAVFRDLRANAPAAVRAELLAVPVSASVADAVCAETLPRLRAASWRLRLTSESAQCERLLEDASAFLDAHSGGTLPAFSVAETVVPVGYERQILNMVGIAYGGPSRDRSQFGASKPGKQRPPAQLPPGLIIQPVGM